MYMQLFYDGEVVPNNEGYQAAWWSGYKHGEPGFYCYSLREDTLTIQITRTSTIAQWAGAVHACFLHAFDAAWIVNRMVIEVADQAEIDEAVRDAHRGRGNGDEI